MVLDRSAIVAILADESRGEALGWTLARAPIAVVGAPTLVETQIVLTRLVGPRAPDTLDAFLGRFRVAVEPFTKDHWRAAASAYAKYGRGNHPAALNFGDCLAYAVAKLSGLPLLCIGDDFVKTDVKLVQPPSD